MKIKIFTTGGTIDGLEYDAEAKAPSKIKSSIPKLLKQSRTEAETESIFSKDSKFINEEDRQLISEKCSKASEKCIVITHGTMTIAKTAEFLQKKNLNKTIVLTGSMIPAGKKDSDAPFNLGTAIMAALTLPKGVYVAMNGRAFKAGTVRKNPRTGVFEEIKQ